MLEWISFRDEAAMGTTISRPEHHGLAVANVENMYKRVFVEVDIALTRGDYTRAVSMIRRAADGHPKVIHSEEELTTQA